MTGLASTPGQLSRSSSQSRTEAVVASWGAELVNSVSVGCYQGKVPSVGPCALLDGLCSVSLSVLPGVGPEVDHRCNASRTAAVDADVDLQRFPGIRHIDFIRVKVICPLLISPADSRCSALAIPHFNTWWIWPALIKT